MMMITYSKIFGGRSQFVWTKNLVIPIFKTGKKIICDNHRGISLTPIITKLLASIILHRFILARENYIREQQAGFRPGRDCTDHIFTLRQHLSRGIILSLCYRDVFRLQTCI